MPFLVVLVLIAVAVIVFRSRRPLPGAARKECHWHPTSGGTESLNAFRCETCGVVAFSQDRKGPAQCKKGLDGRL